MGILRAPCGLWEQAGWGGRGFGGHRPCSGATAPLGPEESEPSPHRPTILRQSPSAWAPRAWLTPSRKPECPSPRDYQIPQSCQAGGKEQDSLRVSSKVT